MRSPIQKLSKLGQSLWLDNIQRQFTESGGLSELITRGEIRGVTSNPTIFKKAVTESNDYQEAIRCLAWSGWNAEQIFWQLAFEDIQAACDLFLPLYLESRGRDGYVSLEVNPNLSDDSTGTIEQAQDLWRTVDRPNLMIKIPATNAGLQAIRQTVRNGVNVNVTLIFSKARYKEVVHAYLSGLEDRLKANLDIRHISSVASFFISRLDTKIDALLPDDSPWCGKAAIACAKLAYEEYRKTFSSPRWRKLKARGAQLQRPLWASTSTKNPIYSDTLYVDNLIGPDTINTVPPGTLDAFREHGKAGLTLTRNTGEARQLMMDLEEAGISMATIARELEVEGVQSFVQAFNELVKTIDSRRISAVKSIGALENLVEKRIAQLAGDRFSERVWDKDASLWSSDLHQQEEISNRLGWLDLPRVSPEIVDDIQSFADRVHKAGFDHFLLLGMGGSSLTAEVFSLVYPASRYVFSILDSTDPAQIIDTGAKFIKENSLFVVSSKSGDTLEVNALMNYFLEQVEGDASRMVAITDSGSYLDAMANSRNFRKIFNAHPGVGGRYSALSHFGLVPAALMGLDLRKLLNKAEWMMRQCSREVPGSRNPGLVLGAVLGEAAVEGRDKLTIIADPVLRPFGSWLEQLITESSGKAGKGIVVVDGEPICNPEQYGQDRIFVYLRISGEYDILVENLRRRDFPVLEFHIEDYIHLSSEFYRWEFACAVACSILGVNPFDQPDVQETKERTKNKIAGYKQNGRFDEESSLQSSPTSLHQFLTLAGQGDYVAINAYLPRDAETTAILQNLRLAILKETRCATMLGFGPRYLHSTGQLHKGGPNSGIFVQITTDSIQEVAIPGQGITFGALQHAQSLGDYEALVNRGKRVFRIHLPTPGSIKGFTDNFINITG